MQVKYNFMDLMLELVIITLFLIIHYLLKSFLSINFIMDLNIN
jgi:hypothetical protein